MSNNVCPNCGDIVDQGCHCKTVRRIMKTERIYECSEEGHANDGSCFCFCPGSALETLKPTPDASRKEALDNYGCDAEAVHPDCPEHGPSAASHTPTPFVDDNDDLINADGITVSTFTDDNGNLLPGATKEHRAFIVKACNVYEDMKKALQLARHKLEMWPEGSNPEFFPEIKAIDKALAKAEDKANG